MLKVSSQTTWVIAACGLTLFSLIGFFLPTFWLDWQPSLAFLQPWRWWTAVFVHYSAAHLMANLLGVVVVTAYGLAAQINLRVGVGIALAWPLMHLALLVNQPQLAHYGGLSGLLHAAVAAINVYLMLHGSKMQTIVAIMTHAMLMVKIGFEIMPNTTHYSKALNIFVAPAAHLNGFIMGTLCAFLIQKRT
jgi:rhomboid family GlyGly-CTERM serine protease